MDTNRLHSAKGLALSSCHPAMHGTSHNDNEELMPALRKRHLEQLHYVEVSVDPIPGLP